MLVLERPKSAVSSVVARQGSGRISRPPTEQRPIAPVLFTLVVTHLLVGFVKRLQRLTVRRLTKRQQQSRLIKRGTPVMAPFPAFFLQETEAALASKVGWLQEHLHLDDCFFAVVLEIEVRDLRAWRTNCSGFSAERQDRLRELWDAFGHMLSMLNYEPVRVRGMLGYTADRTNSGGAPPWAGETLQHYLESNGDDGIRNVSRWFQSLRFGDPEYHRGGRTDACLSTSA